MDKPLWVIAVAIVVYVGWTVRMDLVNLHAPQDGRIHAVIANPFV